MGQLKLELISFHSNIDPALAETMYLFIHTTFFIEDMREKSPPLHTACHPHEHAAQMTTEWLRAL